MNQSNIKRSNRSEVSEEERENGAEKVFLRINGQKFAQCGERCKFIDQEALWTPNRINIE